LETLSLIFSIFFAFAFFLLATIFFSNFFATLPAISLVIFLGTLITVLLAAGCLLWDLFSTLATTFSAILETTISFIINIILVY
jgi:hypothetical protein